MKKKYLLVVAVAIMAGFSSCKKDETTETPATGNESAIKQEQRSVSFYMSGNWCGPCGFYGKPAMKAFMDANSAKAVEISCQVNGGGGAKDPMNCADADAMLGFWGVTGVPTCAIGGNNNPATKISGGPNMQTAVQTKHNEVVGGAAFVNGSIERTVAGSQMNIKVTSKFFKDVTNEYYMSVYVLEDKINKYTQYDGTSSKPAEFNNILRKHVTSTFAVYGENIATGSTSAGATVTKNYTVAIPAEWASANLKVAVVYWSKGADGKFSLSNGIVK